MYAQADLRLSWSHIPHCWKSHSLAQLLYFLFQVMSKEDLETLNERQEIMRNGALSKAMDAI